MVDYSRLEKAIERSGISMTALATKAGMSRGTLYNRLNKIGDFTVNETVGITKALRLTDTERDEIFFR